MHKDRLLAIFIAVSVTVLILSLGNRALWDPDEGRYAEIAREILVLNDWVTPHLNYLHYFEKPMLFMWLIAASFKLFGITEWAARLVSLLAALGGAALVGLMAWRLWGRRAGLTAALILVTSLEYFFLACAVDINMTLALFITSAMVFFWLGQSERKAGWFYLFWISMALAVLTKGPIGVILPGGSVCIYILISRRFSLIRESRPVQGILLFTIITLPWYFLVSIRNPDFFSFFFINQNLQRYTVSTEHNRPFIYLFLALLAGAMPWTLLLPATLKTIRQKPVPDEILFILIWFALILLFFLPSDSKLATYILPCFPPLALLFSYMLKDYQNRGGLLLSLAGGVWACLGLTLTVLPVLTAHGFTNASPEDIDLISKVGIPAGFILLSGAAACVWLGKNHNTTVGLAALAVSLMITAVFFAPHWDSRRSTKTLVQDLPPSARLFTYEKYHQSSNFYAQRKVGLVMCKGELAYGISHDASEDKTVYSLKDLVALMEKDKNVYCLIKQHDLSGLQQMIPGLAVVKQTHRLCLVNVHGQRVLPPKPAHRMENI